MSHMLILINIRIIMHLIHNVANAAPIAIHASPDSARQNSHNQVHMYGAADTNSTHEGLLILAAIVYTAIHEIHNPANSDEQDDVSHA